MSTATMQWNAEQAEAIHKALFRQSFCLIGAAGTGKTTTLRGALNALLENHRCPPIVESTATLMAGTPGVVLVSFTRRAVRNIAKQMPEQLKAHCMTIHRLIEFGPEYYEEEGSDGQIINKMRFVPYRTRENPLPAEVTTVVVDESSMVSTELFAQLLDALPDPSSVQFIFLGDLNQLPPVYGQAVLGVKLLELPIVELTRVYRQALESPIVSMALAVKDNNFAAFNKDAVSLWGAPRLWNAQQVEERITLDAKERGKVTLVPWKKEYDADYSLKAVAGKIPEWVTSGFYKPDEDLMLCPWNKSFGTDELNRHIANVLGKQRGATVFEVIAGFNKYYYAVGDKLMVEKQDAIILDIYRNPKYMGVHPQMPSKDLDRWGKNANGKVDMDLGSDQDVDELLASFDVQEIEDRTSQASHILRVRMLDTDEIVNIDKAAQLNNSFLGYAITVHKAQGSECRKVFFITAGCHSSMLSRELVYTAVTRAQEELVVLMRPTMLAAAARKPRIKGDTLAAKLEFFASRMQEKIA